MKMLLLFVLLLTLDACQIRADFRRCNRSHLQAFLPIEEWLLLAQLGPLTMSAFAPFASYNQRWDPINFPPPPGGSFFMGLATYAMPAHRSLTAPYKQTAIKKARASDRQGGSNSENDGLSSRPVLGALRK